MGGDDGESQAADRGFAGTSLQDVADAIGVTRPALYYYVKSKEELLAKLVTDVTDGPLSELRELVSHTEWDPTERLRALVESIIRRRATRPARFRLLIRSEADLPEELTEAYEHSRRAVLLTVAEVIEEGVKAGQFRPVDARIAALGVLGICNWVAWWIHPDGRDDVDGVTEQLTEMAVAALHRCDYRDPEGEGPLAMLKLVRGDLDRLERLLNE